MTTFDVPISDTTPQPTGKLVRDELTDVIRAVHAKFPDRPRSEVENVVRGTYRDLARTAVVTSHLIPLTLNRSTRVMRAAQGHDRGEHEFAVN